MKKSSNGKKWEVLSLTSSSFLLLVLTLMDFLSFGTKLLDPTTHGQGTENISAILFLYPSIIAQLVFGTFSGITSGVCSGAIMEAQEGTQRIHRSCTSSSKSFGEAIFSTYICIFLSTLLYAGVSHVLRTFKLGNALRSIPVPALYGVMSSIGIMSLKCGYSEIYTEAPWSYMHYCFVVSILLAMTAMWLEMRFPNYFLMIPTFALSIVIAFHMIFILAGKDTDWLRTKNLLPQTKDMNLNLTELLKHFKLSNINPKAIMSNWEDIVSLALFNLIHIVINLPSFAESVGVRTSLDEELRTQSIGNLVSAFFGYPTYFICSTSIYFNRSGGKTRTHSIVGGLAMCSILIIGASLRSILPVVLIATMPMFIGLSLVHSYVYLPLFKLSYADFSILIISGITSRFVKPIGGLLLGTLTNSLYILSSYSSFIPETKAELVERRKDDLELKNGLKTVSFGSEMYSVVEIGFLGFFGTAGDIRKKAKGLNGNVMFDLRHCPHFDANANVAFEEIINGIGDSGDRVLILGRPKNFYLDSFGKYMIASVNSRTFVNCP